MQQLSMTQNTFLESQQKKSREILLACDSTAKSTKCYSSYNAHPLKKSMLPLYVFDPKQPNPQQKQHIDKYVQKVTQQLQRIQKAKTIRKSEMGENEMVFTQQEQLKLQIIDEFLEKGYQLPQDPFAMELYPKGEQEQQVQKQATQPTEIWEFQQWEQMGIKDEVMDGIDQFGRAWVQRVDLQALNKQKSRKNKKQVKLLNFINVNNRQNSNMRKTNNAFFYRQSSLTSQTKHRNKKDKISSIASAPPLQIQNQQHQQLTVPQSEKSINQAPTIPHPHPHPCPYQLPKNSNPAQQQKKERLQNLSENLVTKFQKIKPSLYMTQQRKQALFNTQIIKGAKQLMSRKQYIDFKFVIESDGSKKSLVQHTIRDRDTHDGVDIGAKDIAKILDINKGRLRFEKSRVIQKLRC